MNVNVKIRSELADALTGLAHYVIAESPRVNFENGEAVFVISEADLLKYVPNLEVIKKLASDDLEIKFDIPIYDGRRIARRVQPSLSWKKWMSVLENSSSDGVEYIISLPDLALSLAFILFEIARAASEFFEDRVDSENG